MFCYAFVYTCLKNMKLLPNEMKSARQISKFITSIYEHELLDGYKYQMPKQLIYDYDCEEELF